MYDFLKRLWFGPKLQTEDSRKKELDEYKSETKTALDTLKIELLLANDDVDDKKKRELEAQLRILEKQANPWGIGYDR